MSSSTRAPYAGESELLLVSIDVGTTFTAASFCILNPGKVPEFVDIQSWPKQTTGDAKVASAILYDKRGWPMACGAETEDDATQLDAEMNEWTKSEWFKLYLRPTHLPLIDGLNLPPLPAGKTVDDVFADFLTFVKDQVQGYITKGFAEGARIWAALSPTMEVVLTTPNGWELEQQQRMRAAAQQAGLISLGGGKRVRFVTEAEAAILYAVDTGKIADWIKVGSHVVLCECGGGTIDITSYKVLRSAPLLLEETTSAKCFLAGSVFVTRSCEEYLRIKLQNTEWAEEEVIKRATVHFDRNAKLKFETTEQTSLIDLSSYKTDKSLGIVRGKLRVHGSEMAQFFRPSLDQIQKGLKLVFEESEGAARNVIMVGGLAGSAYIYTQLEIWATELGMNISRPDGPTTKAVPNGGLSWYLGDHVAFRVSKYHYGTPVARVYSPTVPEMEGRMPYVGLDGISRVNGCWSTIVAKGSRVEDGEEYFEDYYQMSTLTVQSTHVTDTVYCYRWESPPAFMKDDGAQSSFHDDNVKFTPGFDAICTITADLRQLHIAAPVKLGSNGALYKVLQFRIGISFGGTELSARLRWRSDGTYQYGPATIAHIPRPPQAV